jgi:hypothetical protein
MCGGADAGWKTSEAESVRFCKDSMERSDACKRETLVSIRGVEMVLLLNTSHFTTVALLYTRAIVSY